MKKTRHDNSNPTRTEAAAEVPIARKESESKPEPLILSDTDPNYTVGYGRPPRSTQFKKGMSGNPRGRKKGLRNFRTVVESELRRRIPLRQGDKIHVATKQQAFILTLVDGALKRDPKAVVALITLLRSLGLLGEASEPTSTEPITAHDGDIIADFLSRQGTSTENTTAPENAADNLQSAPPSRRTRS